MRFAFAIVKLFPWGGLQRDCLRIAQLLHRRGHAVTVFCSESEGELPRGISVDVLPVRAVTNHGRNRKFAEALQAAVKGRFDRVVGFDKLPGLDILYCADPSVAARLPAWQRVLPRYQSLRALEGACFAPGSPTRILALAEAQIDAYRTAWGTSAERFTLLPPGIDPARRRPELRTDRTRERVRATLGVDADAVVWLAIGGQPLVKGFDRLIAALPAFEKATLVIAGLGAEDRKARRLVSAARDLGVEARLRLLGPRHDIPELMAASDVLLHPARLDTTGSVILEAIVNGLPVVATAVCGFAAHVRKADAGIVLSEPFAPAALNDALTLTADPAWRMHWSGNAVAYGADPELYLGIERAADRMLAPAA